MHRYLTLIRLELRSLLTGWMVPLALVLWIAAGVVGLVYGRQLIEGQTHTLATAAARQQEQHRAVLSPLPLDADAGLQVYYLFFHTRHQPSAWTPFSLGVRDLNAFNLKIRVLALQGQLYDSELLNPLLVAFGNFDAAFVLVCLVPLLVIGLTYDVLSAEQESGTWALVRAQAFPPAQLLAIKLGVRTALASVSALVPVVLAVPLLGVPVDVRLAAVACAVAAYVLLWIGAVTLIVSAGRSSAFNLVATSSLWLWWVVLGPALLNVGAATLFPTPEGMELTVRQRQGYHAGWDAPLTETMQRFYARYPEFASYPVPRDSYSHAWYYAMQQRGDEAASAAATSYLEALRARRAWTARWDVLLPPVLLQRLLNGVTGTDLESRLSYLASVARYHEELKRFFFPRIFAGATVRDVDWPRTPVHRFTSESHVATGTLLVLLAQAGCLPLFGLWLAGRRTATTVVS